jgi:hypothetical protein
VVLTHPGATKASDSVDTAGVDRKTNCVTKNFQERSGTKAFVSENQEERQNKNEDEFLSKEKRIYLYLNYRRNEEKQIYWLLNYRRSEDKPKYLFLNH